MASLALAAPAKATSCQAQPDLCDENERPLGPSILCDDGTWAGVVCAKVNNECVWQVLQCNPGSTSCLDIANAPRPPVEVPLAQHPTNKRWATIDDETDPTKKEALLLAGPHTWDNLQDMVVPGSGRKAFPNNQYLDLLDNNGNNFIRLWVWEGFEEGCPATEPNPRVWEKEGSGLYDLKELDAGYLPRLTQRIADAAARNMLVSVMLFQFHSKFEDPQTLAASSPWHEDANKNNVDGESRDILHTTDVEEEAQEHQQEYYVEDVVKALCDYDNIMWEVGNEIGEVGNNPLEEAGTDWQKDIVDKIRAAEVEFCGGVKHIITVNSGWNGETYADLVEKTGADSAAYSDASSQSSGYDVLPSQYPNILTFADTDHLRPVLQSSDPYRKIDWVWKSFIAGMHPIHMEATYNPLHDPDQTNPACSVQGAVYDIDNASFPPARQSMGLASFLAYHVDLAKLRPNPGQCSLGNQDPPYCLVHDDGAPVKEYLAYSADDGAITIEMAPGEYLITWVDAETGQIRGGVGETFRAVGGESPPQTFQLPGGSGRWVLHLSDPARPFLANQVFQCGGN